MTETEVPVPRNSRDFRSIIVELVALAVLVGAIPELFIGGLRNVLGPCGFGPEVCAEYVRQGLVELVASLLCSAGAIVLAFMLSVDSHDGQE